MHTEETKKKLSLIAKTDGRKPPSRLGKHVSVESREKMSKAKKGRKSNFRGKRHTPEAKNKMSGSHVGKKTGEDNPSWHGGKIKIICRVCGKEAYRNMARMRNGGGKHCSRRCNGIWNMRNMKKKDTLIERLVEDELINRGIPYTKQVPLLGITIVDFLLPNNIVIYCDGDYWHKIPQVKGRSNNQDFMLTFYGYKVFRFWEKDIKKSVKNCINKMRLPNVNMEI